MVVMLRRLLLILPAAALLVHGDEGMWLFNQFPKELVKKRYGFEVTDAFLDHLRGASMRLSDGGSGSFVSPRGLLFTNHHVGSECIQKLSSAGHNYMANGFFAATEADEKQCSDLELDVLLKIDDVTARVTGGIPAGAAPAEVNRQRKAAMTRIEKDCAASNGNRCDVVTLYSGGQYHLYQYKKYTDVRLVFAPEADIAAFGGDPDNFTYPRYCLDFSLFRAYENGRPVEPKHYFRWSKRGVREGDLVFVPGNPGTTGRLATMAQLEFYRDVAYPLVHRRLASLVRTLEEFGAEDLENARVARDNLLSQQNSYKAYAGFLDGLRDRKLMEQKRQEETRLRAAVANDPKLRETYARTWEELAAAYQGYERFYKQYWLLETAAARGSDLLNLARDVIRYAEEKTKPNEERLRTFVDSALPSLEQEMYSEAPLAPAMEIAVLTDYFRFLRSELGPADPTVAELLGRRTPEVAAREYVSSSKLKDVAVRKRLAGDVAAVRATTDGMIRLARILDGPARKYRKMYEDQVEAAQTTGAAKIARARFALTGVSEYPDATFTLRLAYGRVAGYRDAAGQAVPFATVFDGVFRRATGKEPYKLPPSWIKARSRLDLKTPFNFVDTSDTHGGNSGSPTLNTEGEIVGILFDGNIESLPNRFVYTEERARSVHVSTLAILEALEKIYRAGRLVAELGMASR